MKKGFMHKSQKSAPSFSPSWMNGTSPRSLRAWGAGSVRSVSKFWFSKKWEEEGEEKVEKCAPATFPTGELWGSILLFPHPSYIVGKLFPYPIIRARRIRSSLQVRGGANYLSFSSIGSLVILNQLSLHHLGLGFF